MHCTSINTFQPALEKPWPQYSGARRSDHTAMAILVFLFRACLEHLSTKQPLCNSSTPDAPFALRFSGYLFRILCVSASIHTLACFSAYAERVVRATNNKIRDSVRRYMRRYHLNRWKYSRLDREYLLGACEISIFICAVFWFERG